MLPGCGVSGSAPRRLGRLAPALFVGLCLLAARAAAGTQAGCAVAEMPRQFAGAGIRVGLWLGGFDEPDEPKCVAAGGEPWDVVTVADTTFDAPGGTDEILGRIARISAYPSIRYWSHTRDRWRELVTEAWPVATIAGARREPVDLPLAELTEGASFLLYQKENTPAEEVTYRVTVERRRPGRLVVTATNAVEIYFLGFTIFSVGDYVFRHSFQRGADGQWHYHGLADERGGRSPLATIYQESFVNRMAALAAYLTGKTLNDGSLPRIK